MNRIDEYPYMVESCDLETSDTAFPSHTHGLTEVGWPELFIDPLAFGPMGNAQRINAIWKHLSKQENRWKLKAVLDGKIIKINDRELLPDKFIPDPNTYCLRKVSADFGGVKLAYPADHPEVALSGMRFIQIWVEGDDFALDDDYYEGGVTW